MASNRRKQDEKHLKVLRELGSNPANRTCFDCHQKGPTYINMTIGSFVCTSCSGILRGLNPPHRVKSISMASFTPEEIEQIRSKGNQCCQAVWLGLYDGKSGLFPDTKDEHKIRDFMIAKYEKKRKEDLDEHSVFYVDPSVALKNVGNNQPKSGSSSNASTPGSDNRSLGSVAAAVSSSNPSTSVSRPISSIQNAASTPCLNGLPQQSHTMKPSSSVYLLNSLGGSSLSSAKTNFAEKADLFANPSDPTTPVATSAQNGGFADFENANIFTSAAPSFPSLDSPTETSPSIPTLYSYSFSSPPHGQSCFHHQRSPSSSPNDDAWEAIEEELTAAMPLIPTGEVPPTYQPSAKHQSASKKGHNSPTLMFASGVSAQYVTPSVGITSSQLSHLRETKSSSLPSSLNNSPSNRSHKDKTYFDWKNEINCTVGAKADMKYYGNGGNVDPLVSAMPLLSLDASLNKKCDTAISQSAAKKYARNLSLPLGSSVEDNSASGKQGKQGPTRNLSSGDLTAKSTLPPKEIRKVSSYQNVSSGSWGDQDAVIKKISFPRQLSAISQKLRARLMSDYEYQSPQHRLSSSLPENSPLSLNPDLLFSKVPLLSNAAKDTNQVEPITVTCKKSCTINRASDFTNTVDDNRAHSVFRPINSNTVSNLIFPDSREHSSTSFTSDDKLTNKLIGSSCDVAEQSSNLHDLFPTYRSDVCSANDTQASESCRPSIANLTTLASPSVTGTSTKYIPAQPHLSFSSNPLTPISSSKSVSIASASGMSSGVNPQVREDRYAALKDLDEAYKTQKEAEKPPQGNGGGGLFGSSPTNPTAFSGVVNGGTHPSNASGNTLFGTSPVTSSTAFYPVSPGTATVWNTGFQAANPFAGTATGTTASPWSSSQSFGTPPQSQANPFSGSVDPNFNNHFGFEVNGTANANWASFGNPKIPSGGAPVSKINPWVTNAAPNPFAAPQIPLSGSPYNPFL